jgi:hypothetical protein
VLSVTLPKWTPATVSGDRERVERKMGNWGFVSGGETPFYRAWRGGGFHLDRRRGGGGSVDPQYSTELLVSSGKKTTWRGLSGWATCGLWLLGCDLVAVAR